MNWLQELAKLSVRFFPNSLSSPVTQLGRPNPQAGSVVELSAVVGDNDLPLSWRARRSSGHKGRFACPGWPAQRGADQCGRQPPEQTRQPSEGGCRVCVFTPSLSSEMALEGSQRTSLEPELPFRRSVGSAWHDQAFAPTSIHHFFQLKSALIQTQIAAAFDVQGEWIAN